ncbi:hypothetical protein BBJ28_00025856 [Nothophytophthora sp. Chile5]|nr:hypothetical protein BBJ28_00025856 [Nothophytophthora sp. Chile5]
MHRDDKRPRRRRSRSRSRDRNGGRLERPPAQPPHRRKSSQRPSRRRVERRDERRSPHRHSRKRSRSRHRQHERPDALDLPGGESQPPLRQDATTSVAEEEQQVAAIMATLSSSVDVPDSVGKRPAAPEPRVGLAEERADSPALTGSISPADPCSLRQVRVIGRPVATGPIITSPARAEGSLGLTAWAPQAFVDEFRADNCSAVTEMGVEWPTLLRFIKACNKCAHVAGDGEVCQYTLKKNLLRDSNTGTRVADQFCEMPLAEGVYICAGFTPQRVSHCFAVTVTQLGRFATDEDARAKPLLEYVHPWLAGLQFVRRMVVRK